MSVTDKKKCGQVEKKEYEMEEQLSNFNPCYLCPTEYDSPAGQMKSVWVHISKQCNKNYKDYTDAMLMGYCNEMEDNT